MRPVRTGTIGPDGRVFWRRIVCDMFVRYFVGLEMPASVAAEALLDEPSVWMAGLARDAGDRGDHLMAEVGFATAVRIERPVEVEVGAPIRLADKTVLPLRWRPMSTARLLPDMEADVELAPLGERRSQLAMTARYTPPFGLLGRVADRALLHRVAEATVKDFVDAVAAQLERRAFVAGSV